MVLLLYLGRHESRGGSTSGRFKVIATMERDEASLIKSKGLESVLTKDLYQVLEGEQQNYENSLTKEETQSL